MNDTQVYYSIGYRDALAVLCAEARLGGTDAAVRKAAEQLLEMDPEHCHAKIVLEQMNQEEKEQEEKEKQEQMRQEAKTMCSTCDSMSGIPRIDNGVAAGTHCNTCWEQLVSHARKRSW